MPTWTLPGNLTDPVDILVNTSTQVPILFPGIILLVFGVIIIAGAYSQERKTGKSNISMWFAVSSLITTTASLFLFLIDGLVPLEFMMIMMGITLFSVIYFFFNTSRNVDGL